MTCKQTLHSQKQNPTSMAKFGADFFLSICRPLGLFPVLGPLERYMKPTLDPALL